MSYYIISRYDVSGWLELEAAARPLFHRQHGVMAELAKWVVPILCRGPGEMVRRWWTVDTVWLQNNVLSPKTLQKVSALLGNWH